MKSPKNRLIVFKVEGGLKLWKPNILWALWHHTFKKNLLFPTLNAPCFKRFFPFVSSVKIVRAVILDTSKSLNKTIEPDRRTKLGLGRFSCLSRISNTRMLLSLKCGDHLATPASPQRASRAILPKSQTSADSYCRGVKQDPDFFINGKENSILPKYPNI